MKKVFGLFGLRFTTGHLIWAAALIPACIALSAPLELLWAGITLAVVIALAAVVTMSTLGEGDLRFNELRRRIGDISQKMLSSTLKVLERDGLVQRTVLPTVPPQVEYALTDLGRELLEPVAH